MTFKLRELPNGMRIADKYWAETQQFYRDIFDNRIYLKNGIRLRPNDVVFDVGANIGLFTLLVHSLQPTAKIFAFEPAPPLFELLETNTRLQGSDAKLFPLGLGEQSAFIPFTFYPNSSGMSSFYSNERDEKDALSIVIKNELLTLRDLPEAKVLLANMNDLLAHRLQSKIYNCEMQTLSQVIGSTDLSRIDLLKIDAQKSEVGILKTLHRMDWEKICQIVLEVHNNQGQLDVVHSLLVRSGYKVVIEQDELYRDSCHFMVYATTQH
jgi:phthiocerol/phenolphthiocerol synthesis type-I polyketide synthase E